MGLCSVTEGWVFYSSGLHSPPSPSLLSAHPLQTSKDPLEALPQSPPQGKSPPKPLLHFCFCSLVVKNSPASADARDVVSIPGSGKSPGGGSGNPLQYSCLENSTGRGAWQATVHGATESRIRPRDWAHTQEKETVQARASLRDV